MALMDALRALFDRRASPRGRAAYHDMVARLYKAEIAARALKGGDKAPAFLLPNAEGALIASEDLLAAGPLVVSFFRGGWCPYCDLTMRAMQDAWPSIRAAGASFAAIWPETGGAALRTKRERGLTYEFLIDVDHAAAMQFGIVFRVPELYRARLSEQGIDLAERQGNPGWLLPLAATYLIAPDGFIRYAFVDGDFTARAEPDDIVARIRALTA
jgi:peroxiredoxin